jgi:glucose-6-phosphate 1-dehydrogenase
MSPETADLTQTLAADNLQCAIPTDPAAIVIFGASGDLVKRKLIPALYDLASHACLAPRYSILGFARSPMTDDSFRSATGDAVRSSSEVRPR